ncbi:hypothetical protein NQ315_007164 [Exocentrus adspersus]|uniref:GH18 domain-containing protein n=1 Tax=Exocentrus adspersus TaxID=1586481 RepID=A0AAV8WCN4_9CUCU|nr:hypothetical protein NQ315_007164 [Exocentrus adspersus]
MASDREKRLNFVNSTKEFLKTYNFEGLDVDWEKPAAADSDNLVALLRDLREGFDKTNPDWVLSAAVYPNPDSGYNVPEINKYVNMLNIMTYNYFGSWSAHTGQNSPLFESSMDSSYEKAMLNVAASIQNWISAGASREKINMGLAFYGRSFTLVNEKDYGVHAPVLGAGKTPTPTFRQVCTGYANWTTVWDKEQMNPYKYLGNQWLGYDDERSIKRKVQYAVAQDLAGVMIWHIGGDDLKGDCGEKQGLLKIIYNETHAQGGGSLGASQPFKRKVHQENY